MHSIYESTTYTKKYFISIYKMDLHMSTLSAVNIYDNTFIIFIIRHAHSSDRNGMVIYVFDRLGGALKLVCGVGYVRRGCFRYQAFSIPICCGNVGGAGCQATYIESGPTQFSDFSPTLVVTWFKLRLFRDNYFCRNTDPSLEQV